MKKNNNIESNVRVIKHVDDIYIIHLANTFIQRDLKMRTTDDKCRKTHKHVMTQKILTFDPASIVVSIFVPSPIPTTAKHYVK